MTTDFEQKLLAELTRVKELLRANERLHRMTLSITAEGRMDGELNVTFALGEYSDTVRGGSLDACVSEFLRREGWSARHAPLCLPNVQEHRAQADDEIPF